MGILSAISGIFGIISNGMKFIMWWKRPSKEIKRVEDGAKKQQAKDREIVIRGSDAEMENRINRM